MAFLNKAYLLLILLSAAQLLHAYTVITPKPFSVINKNYIKLQVLADNGDYEADSVIFDVFYNSGTIVRMPTDSSLSCVIKLNEFNDGLFYVRTRVFHNNVCDTLGSPFDKFGIPCILDRRLSFNAETFNSVFLSNSRKLDEYYKETKKYKFDCNNNILEFTSFWDYDSIYFRFEVKDENLNYSAPIPCNLFQAKNFLKALWTSDCIEIGLDLLHNRSEWKQADDYELVVDVKGNFIGNQWNVADSLFANWGKYTRVGVTYLGTLNNNRDTDEGYVISIAVPWKELNFKPKENVAIGFDIQLYDKDADYDESFRTSLNGTNPESNDNTSEWANLVLEPKEFSYFKYILSVFFLTVAAGIIYFIRRRKRHIITNKVSEVKYSNNIDTVIAYISEHYHEPELSRQYIAQKVFLSEKYLSSLFKKEVGINLVSYINKNRIEKAVELLKTTKLPIAEIAFKVGFNSMQNFDKNFKTFMKKSPSEFRQE